MENNVQIVLTSPAQGVLDIDKNTEFPLSFAVGDIRDISKRKGTFSKSIKLAGTKNNNLLLNNYFDVNIEAGTFNINKLQKCKILQNGVPIIEQATFQLISIDKVQKSVNNEEMVEYTVLIKDSISDFFTLINNRELTDIELGYLDHRLTSTAITQSFTHSWEDGYKYIAPFSDSGTTTLNYNINQMQPGIYAKTYFDKIFEGAGFTYEWDSLSADTIQFDKLIIPYGGERPFNDNSSDVFTGNIVYPSFINLAGNLVGIFDLTDESTTTKIGGLPFFPFTEIPESDPENYFNLTTGEWRNPYIFTAPDYIEFQVEITYRAYVQNFGSVTAFLNGSPTNGFNYAPSFGLWRNPVDQTNNFQKAWGATNILPLQIGGGITLPAGQRIELTSGSTTGSVTLRHEGGLVNDRFYLRFGFNNAFAFNQGIFSLINPNEFIEWETGIGNPYFNVLPYIELTSLRLIVQPYYQYIGYNSVMRLNNYIPKKVKQSDFVKSIFQMYNIYAIPDTSVDNKLILKNRDQFYDEGPEVDWTEKLNKNLNQTIEFLPDVTAKKMIFKYKYDDNDPFQKNYKTGLKEEYGQVEVVFDSEYNKNIENKELIFSPTIIGENNFGYVLPLIDALVPKNNIKIALDGPLQSGSTVQFIEFQGGGLTINGLTGNTLPLISHFNTQFNPTFDINYGINDYYFYNSGEVTNNNLYNLHWRRTTQQMNEGKLMTAYFNLNESDINQLKLNQRVYVKDSWWNINQITDYKANKNEPTKVELISIDDSLIFSPFISTITSGNNGINNPNPTVFNNFIADFEFATNFFNGTIPVDVNGTFNQTNGFTRGSVIKGDNNLVNTKAFVFGDSNIVDSGATNAFVIGNGKSATTANTLYSDNIQLSSGSTINGITVDDLDLFAVGNTPTAIIRKNATAIASGDYSLAIGNNTTASGDFSVAMGAATIASGLTATASGEGTKAFGDYSFAEGYQTTASGEASHAEGFNTTASGDYSHAGGINTKATHQGEWAIGASLGSQVGQIGKVIYVGETNDDTPTLIYLDYLATPEFTIPTNSVYSVSLDVIARDNASGDISNWIANAVIKNVSGTTSFVGTPSITQFASDGSMVTTDIDLIANNTTNSLDIEVTGLAGADIRWVASVHYTAII